MLDWICSKNPETDIPIDFWLFVFRSFDCHFRRNYVLHVCLYFLIGFVSQTFPLKKLAWSEALYRKIRFVLKHRDNNINVWILILIFSLEWSLCHTNIHVYIKLNFLSSESVKNPIHPFLYVCIVYTRLMYF